MTERLHWESVARETARAAAAEVLFDRDAEPLDGLEVTGRSATLPFYDDARLLWLCIRRIRAEKEDRPLDVFILKGGHSSRSVLLDGTAGPIHHFNQFEKPVINTDTAIDYLRFFCFAVRGDEGPFLLYESATDGSAQAEPAVAATANLARTIDTKGRSTKGDYLFAAIVHYGNSLFQSEFAVTESGMVEMQDDEVLLSDAATEAIPKLAELQSREIIIAKLQSSGAVAPTGPSILRTMVELQLEVALEAKRETRLLSYFNEKFSQQSALDRFARFVATTSPIVAIESTLPFVEETVARIVVERLPPGKKLKVVTPSQNPNDDTRVAVSVPAGGGALLLIPLHSYGSIVDVERVAHEIGARDVACLIGCERVGHLPGSLRQVVDLTLTLPRFGPELFRAMFSRIMAADPPDNWEGEDAHWVSHVHHSDFQHPRGLELTPQEALNHIRERAHRRLRDVEPAEGLGLENLHGLGEARAFAEDLIADIHDAIAGRLSWDQVDRGILLVGAPGTGKTTLARAIAKDCGIRFVNASAASWQASGHLGDHIRAMRSDFALARRFAPAILFIDEIDSIGNREKFAGQNAQYSTQVVNALLEQLQGIDPQAPVIVIAATNHVDQIDAALRRAGRLDREIAIPRPNTEALAEIYRHYLFNHIGDAAARDIDVRELGSLSLGKTGADVELYVRGAFRRARKARRAVRQIDVVHEITSKPRSADSSPRLTPEELHRVAVHEAGHALASYLADGKGEQLGFISVVPRGNRSLGFVAHLASDRVLLTRTDYLQELEVLLAGRAAEEITFGEQSISGGAGGPTDSDLALASRRALGLVMYYGLGPEQTLLWSDTPDPSHLRQAEEILGTTYKSVLMKLSQHRDSLIRIADALIEHQELSGDELRTLIGGIG